MKYATFSLLSRIFYAICAALFVDSAGPALAWDVVPFRSGTNQIYFDCSIQSGNYWWYPNATTFYNGQTNYYGQMLHIDTNTCSYSVDFSIYSRQNLQSPLVNYYYNVGGWQNVSRQDCYASIGTNIYRMDQVGVFTDNVYRIYFNAPMLRQHVDLTCLAINVVTSGYSAEGNHIHATNTFYVQPGDIGVARVAFSTLEYPNNVGLFNEETGGALLGITNPPSSGLTNVAQGVYGCLQFPYNLYAGQGDTSIWTTGVVPLPGQ